MKDVLRSIAMDSGEQYVIMDLVLLMLKLSVNNWDIIIIIDMITYVCKYYNLKCISTVVFKHKTVYLLQLNCFFASQSYNCCRPCVIFACPLESLYSYCCIQQQTTYYVSNTYNTYMDCLLSIPYFSIFAILKSNI